MAYPQLPVATTDQQAITSILSSESGILDCMAAYFGLPNGVVALISAQTTLEKQLELFNSILPAYSNKENSIAKVIEGAAKKLAADKNMNPCDLANC
ncbi:hypothetical protein [Anaerorhabdus sp.]|uniref:hypothetical protein n=1 Tax=Anaerorhabdus sp. TaxID=1872524 RepID=UPI002FCC0EA1